MQPVREVNLIIKTLTVGPIMANCFILGCKETNEAVVIDPGDEADRILTAMAEDQLALKYIINTHGHFDHVGGNKSLHETTKAGILIHALDEPMLKSLAASAAAWGLAAENSPPPERTLADGDTVSFGKFNLDVIHTPGHTPGQTSLLVELPDTGAVILTSDTISRPDELQGDFEGYWRPEQAKQSAERLMRIAKERDAFVIYGHCPQQWPTLRKIPEFYG